MSTEQDLLNTMPAVKIMLNDRTVEVSDIEIAKRKGSPMFEVANANGTLEWTCRLPVALRAYDKCMTAVIYKISAPYTTKRIVRRKRNKVELPV